MPEQNCFLCDRPNATHPKSQYLSNMFTDWQKAKNPQAEHLCDFCVWALKLRCWYFNPAKEKYVKLFGRGWSSLFQDDALMRPTISGEHTEGKDILRIVSALPTRAEMRGWLLDPPEPPFTICIAESGQKHIMPFAVQAQSRDYYPVQFESDCLWIDRAEFARRLTAYEQLMAMGFSKAEIDAGEWRSDRLMAALSDDFLALDAAIAHLRGTRLMELLAYVAQCPQLLI